MTQLVIALDVPHADPALRLVASCAKLPVWYKVGLELFVAEGPLFVRQLIMDGHSLFLDLKFHDIPNTVKNACRSAAALGVQMLTIHLAGGEAMSQAALAGCLEGCRADRSPPLVMGVTVLTSEALPQEAATGLVVQRATLARQYGLHGVVCSGQEAAAIKTACGPELLCLCPGIRFADDKKPDDQARVCTPVQAVKAGADFLVMGRPVIHAEDPPQAALRALQEMRELA